MWLLSDVIPVCCSCCQAKRKRDRVGDVKIVVAGCVAQQEGQQLLRRVPEVDVVMGESAAAVATVIGHNYLCAGRTTVPDCS